MANNERPYSAAIYANPLAADIAAKICNAALDIAIEVECPPASVIDAIKSLLDGIPENLMTRMRETGERITFEIEEDHTPSGRA